MDSPQGMEDLRKEVFNIKQDVEQILFILTGTEYEQGQGLLNRIANDRIQIITIYEKLEKRVNETYEKLGTKMDETYQKLDKRITSIEKWKDKAVWIGIGFAFGSGIGLTELFRAVFFR